MERKKELEYLQIAHMPFLQVSQTFEFGNLKLLPFDDLEIQKQFSPDKLNFLKWYFAKYVNLMQEHLKVTIISYQSKILGPFDKMEVNEMYDSIACLSFLSTWDNNPFFPVSTDNFALHLKSFQPHDKGIAIESGSLIRSHETFSPDVTDKIIFVRPQNIPSWNFVNQPWLDHEELYKGFSLALCTNYNSEWFSRVIRSIKIFNTSYRNMDGIGYYDRLLLLVTAFETLLMENTSSQYDFAKAVVNSIGMKDEDVKSGPRNQRIWAFAEKLYELRSRYSHGNDMQKVNNPFPDMFKSGAFIFGLAVMSIFREQSIIQQRADSLLELDFGLFPLLEESKGKRRTLSYKKAN